VSFAMGGTNGAGLAALRKRMQDGQHAVLVGVPVAAGNDDDGTPLVLVAAAVEFGHTRRHPDQPERPFLRQGITQNSQTFSRLNAINLRKVVAGTMDTQTALGQLGVVGVGKVQAQMRSGEFAPNRPSTLAQKARKHYGTQPTIASRQLVKSITYQIEGTQSAGAGAD
jgi:hypothetical protein